AFRHFCSGSLALASLNRACRNLVPTFPQRSPPSLLTTAACGGLRSAPDCRPRRTFLHLSYSYAPPCGPALLVTQNPVATPPSVATPNKPHPETNGQNFRDDRLQSDRDSKIVPTPVPPPASAPD